MDIVSDRCSKQCQIIKGHSIELERISLSLVGDHEDPTIDPKPPISVSAVVTILDSITGTEVIHH